METGLLERDRGPQTGKTTADNDDLVVRTQSVGHDSGLSFSGTWWLVGDTLAAPPIRHRNVARLGFATSHRTMTTHNTDIDECYAPK